MNKSDLNPLNSLERETSGADTWRKYRYQYNWALYEMIQDHEEGKEYVIFMEYHEDVVFGNSLDLINVKFSFNQIKTSTKKYTPYSICKREKDKLSVLGKLINSCDKKRYSHLIDEIVIVSTGGFGFNSKNEVGFSPKASFSELEEKQFTEIQEKIKDELSLSDLPTNLYFVVPVLPENNFQDMVIGGISRLASKLYPNSRFDSNEIYRVLMDELGRKGEITEQFVSWDKALEYKGLTSRTVNSVIAQHTQVKDEVAVQTELIRLCDELGHDSISRRDLIKAFKRYRSRVLYNQDVLLLMIREHCSNLIKRCISEGKNLSEIVSIGMQENIEKFPSFFILEIDAEAAILYQFINDES